MSTSDMLKRFEEVALQADWVTRDGKDKLIDIQLVDPSDPTSENLVVFQVFKQEGAILSGIVPLEVYTYVGNELMTHRSICKIVKGSRSIKENADGSFTVLGRSYTAFRKAMCTAADVGTDDFYLFDEYVKEQEEALLAEEEAEEEKATAERLRLAHAAVCSNGNVLPAAPVLSSNNPSDVAAYIQQSVAALDKQRREAFELEQAKLEAEYNRGVRESEANVKESLKASYEDGVKAAQLKAAAEKAELLKQYATPDAEPAKEWGSTIQSVLICAAVLLGVVLLSWFFGHREIEESISLRELNREHIEGSLYYNEGGVQYLYNEDARTKYILPKGTTYDDVAEKL